MKKRSSPIKPEDLRLVLKLLFQNWYLLVTIVPVAYFIAYIYAYRLTDIYQAQCQILLKSDKKYDVGSQIYQGLSGYDAYAEQTNQKRVITSYDLISEVVRKCDFSVDYYLVGRLKKTAQYKSAPYRIEVDFINEALYGSIFSISFQDKKINISYFVNGDRKELSFPYRSKIESKDFIFKLYNNSGERIPKLSKLAGIEYEFVVNRHENLVGKYRSLLGVAGEDFTSILDISLEDDVPQRAIDFLDTLYVEYSQYSVKQRLLINANTLSFIDLQMNDLLGVLNNVEDDLENYKAKEDILNLNQEEQEYYSKLVAYDEEVNKLNLRIKTINQLEEYIKNAKDENLLPPSFYVPEGDAYLTSTLQQLYSMQLKKINDLYDSKSENPNLKRTENSFELIKTDMFKYLAQTKKAIEQKISDVRKLSGQYENLLRAVPKSQRQILNIKRRIDVNEKLYQYLLEQRANIAIERSSIVPETELLEKPRSLGAIRPNRKSIINTGLMIGFALVAAIVALRYFFFDKFESMAELKDYTNIPVVGGIPFLKIKPNFGSKEYLQSDLAESIRRVRSNLQFMGVDFQHKIILVSSMFPSEGKTFTSVNLAYMSALSGMKVLLIDFDLHKPNVHKTLNLKNNTGVTLALAQKSYTVDEIKQNLLPNLDVITAGPLPPNASEMVMNPFTNEYILKMKEQYDIVILDTPPLHLITDARVLMQLSDINLLVINARNATKSNLNDIEELYADTSIKNFSLIMNGIKFKRWQYIYGKYDYKYAYKYGYAYGYGYKYGGEA